MWIHGNHRRSVSPHRAVFTDGTRQRDQWCVPPVDWLTVRNLNVMRILLTGKHGQVGVELQSALPCLGEVHAVDYTECDLADAAAISTLVWSVRPDLIVTLAEYTAVDKAESEPQLAHAINAVAPGVF